MESSVENRSPNTSCNSPPEKSTKTVRRKQKFRSEWLSESDFSTWLIPDKSDIYKATCILCKTSMKAEICVIRTHAKGQTHMRNISGTKKQTPITTFTESNINNNSNNSVHRAEIKLCGFLSKHNLSFKIMDHLGPLLKSCFPDSQIAQKIQMKSTKSSAIVKNVIVVSEKEYLANKLKNNKFSILVDESTDISAIKALCIVIRFYDCEASNIVSRFWDLCQVFSDTNLVDAATAEHLFNIVKLSFDEYQIPYSNIIGFVSDGCNDGVTACKQLPRQCEDLARDVFNLLSASAKRQFALKEFQEFLDVEFTTLNEIFQSEKPMITSMYNAVKITYLELLQSYMQSDYISQTSLADINPTDKTRFLSSTRIYAGVDVINFFSSPEFNERMKEDFFNGCIMFLSTGCNEIKSRFDFGNALVQK
ncbi:uncharacterized protein [Chelonus insularis]|uniref:uncharacterized protein n=1 Tax=Chelonus insularis TaxID=460826 RepID=UPI00158A26E1|nr:uncharacterized protein LOC118066370 [Chelonus insularis]